MITFYDLASKLPDQAWSPNTFKTRISLNYKGIPYKTEWVEYPDVEPLMKKIGGEPTSKKADGRNHYTLPAIRDSSTGQVVTDSMPIAIYLDETYPDTPPLFPALSTGGSTRAAVATLESIFSQTLNSLFPIVLPASHANLNPVSAAYFRSTREQTFGKPLEAFAPAGPIRDGMWSEAKEGFEKLAALYDKNGEGKIFYFGDTFSFADAIIVSYVLWMKLILSDEEWNAVASWSRGRWGRLLESTKKLQVVN